MKIKYYCPFGATSGYGRAAHDYAACLVRAGVELQIVPLHDVQNEDDIEPRYRWLVPYAEKEITDPTHVIVHTIPQYAHEFVTTDLAPAKGVKKIALTTWETSKLPEVAVDRLNEHFDLTLVPSQWNEDVFRSSGVRETATAFHSFDPNWWYNPPFWNKGLDTYDFYSISEWNDRKNIVGLLKAYYSAFGNSSTAVEKVRLTIVCRAYHQESVTALERAMNMESLPRVDWIGQVLNGQQRLSEGDLRILHQSAHCYVSLARGEGWGLPAFEAAFMGNHVIYPDHSGHQTFMHYTTKRSPIRTMETPVVDAKLEEPVSFAGLHCPATAKVPGFGFAGDQTWAEPDLEMAIAAMRDAFDRRAGADGGGIHDEPIRDKYRRKFSYEAVGAQMKKILEDL